MDVAPQVGDLFQRWQALRYQGRDVSVDELCVGQPELAGKLAAQISHTSKMRAPRDVRPREKAIARRRLVPPRRRPKHSLADVTKS
jgi:hypothetical protein